MVCASALQNHGKYSLKLHELQQNFLLRCMKEGLEPGLLMTRGDVLGVGPEDVINKAWPVHHGQKKRWVMLPQKMWYSFPL